MTEARLPAAPLHAPETGNIHRGAWLITLCGVAMAGCYLLANGGLDTALMAHFAIVVVVTAAVPLAARNLNVRQSPDDIAEAAFAIRRWSTRNLYLAASAITLSAAFLSPAHSSQPAEYSMPVSIAAKTAQFETVRKFEKPTCPWFDEVDKSCRYWLVNGKPFPQAAPYVTQKGQAPRPAPFVRSPDKKAVVYLHRHSRRMIYQDADGTHPLTGPLADQDVPMATLGNQTRWIALARHDAQIIDTRNWTTRHIPGVTEVHDLNEDGFVVTMNSRVHVLDSQGAERMSLPLNGRERYVPETTYHLRRDGRRLVVVRGDVGRVETFDPTTGKRLSRVTPAFPGDDSLGAGLGWSKQGPFLVRGYDSERVYSLDLATGKLRRRDG